MPVGDNDAGRVDGGIRSHNTADQHNRNEVPDPRAAEEELRQQNQNNGDRGQNRSRQSLIDTDVDDVPVGFVLKERRFSL